MSLLPLLLLALAGSPPSPQSSGPAARSEQGSGPGLEQPFQDLTPEQALEAIRDTRKVAVVAFHTAWDGESRRMREHTWADDSVRTWLSENAVAVTVDGDADKDTALLWKVTTYPVVVLVRPDGRVIERFKGYHGPGDFLTLAKAAIAGKLGGGVSELVGDRALDPLAHLERAGALYVNTRIEECLEEYLWCLDQADGQDEGFLDRNLDFILKKVMTLGRTTARALPELMERRDGLTVRAFAGLLGTRLTEQLVRYNFWLRHEYRTLAVFDELAERGANQDVCRRVLFPHVLAQLVGHGRYEDTLAYAGDPLVWITPLMGQQRQLLGRAAAPTAAGKPAPYSPAGTDTEATGQTGAGAKPGAGLSTSDAALLRELRQDMVLRTGFFYEALLGSGRGADADRLVKHVADFHPTGRLFSLLIQHALRLEMPQAARRLEHLAGTLLTEKGMQLVRRTARKIPGEQPPTPHDDTPSDTPSDDMPSDTPLDSAPSDKTPSEGETGIQEREI